MRLEDILAVQVVEEEGEARVLSPAVGIWSAIPANGTLVEAGADLGTLKQLNRRVSLVLPEGPSGRIDLADPRRARALAYGEPMFRLSRIALDDRTGHSGAAASGAASGEENEDGLLALRAPTDGVFYLRPAPDAAPFVDVGQKIRRGQPIGLIEVMKTFNQILYDGTDLPEEGTVSEIRVGDGEEVSAGQPLLVVR